jgi:hypothetical protein
VYWVVKTTQVRTLATEPRSPEPVPNVHLVPRPYWPQRRAWHQAAYGRRSESKAIQLDAIPIPAPMPDQRLLIAATTAHSTPTTRATPYGTTANAAATEKQIAVLCRHASGLPACPSSTPVEYT